MKQKYLLFFIVLIAGCFKDNKQSYLTNIAYSPVGSFDLGSLDSARCYNTYFAFSIPVRHEYWSIFNEELMNKRLEGNKRDLGISDSSYKETMLNNYNLLTIEKDYNISKENDQSITIFTERLRSLPNVSNALQYLNWTEKFLKENHSANYPKYKVLSIDTTSISHHKFLVQTILIEDDSETKRYQKTISAQYDTLLLNIILNYKTEAQLVENNKILQQIIWK